MQKSSPKLEGVFRNETFLVNAFSALRFIVDKKRPRHAFTF